MDKPVDKAPDLQFVVPKTGLLFSEISEFNEMLSKPIVMALKSASLKVSEERDVAMQQGQ